jgi:ABC-type transport system involved in multi-copper enzyme maturation permease subunit
MALIGSMQMYKPLTMGLETQLMIDVSLALINLLAIVIAIYLGANSVAEEYEHRTAHVLLTKPVSRKELVMGHFLGTWLAASIMVAVLTVASLIIVGLSSQVFAGGIVIAAVMIIFQAGVVAAFSVLFSTFFKPMTATIASTGIFLILHAIYIYPGVAQSEYMLQAINCSSEQRKMLKEKAGKEAEISLSGGVETSMQSVPRDANPDIEQSDETEVQIEEEETGDATRSYTISTNSSDTYNKIKEFLDDENIASINVSGKPTSNVMIISSILPDLNHLNIKNEVGNGFSINGKRYFMSLIYSLLLMAGFIMLSLFFIEKKEIV